MQQPDTSPTSARQIGMRLVLAVATTAALGGVFSMYVAPEFMLTLADQLWSCF